MIKQLKQFFVVALAFCGSQGSAVAADNWQIIKFKEAHLSEAQMKGLAKEPSGVYSRNDLAGFELDPLPIVHYSNDIKTSQGILRFAILNAACGMQNCYLDYTITHNGKTIKPDDSIFICQSFETIEFNIQKLEVRSCGGRPEKLKLR